MTSTDKAVHHEPNVAIIIRSKDNVDGVKQLLAAIVAARLDYPSRIDTIIVDTESKDSTRRLAQNFGAHVISIAQKDFTYPKSLNLGLESVADDVEAAFLTVDHAQPIVLDFIRLGIRHFVDPSVSGVYGITLPSDNASVVEKLLAPKYIRGTRRISNVRMGVLGATNSMIRMSTWKKYPFDNTYAGGGEDTEWARQAIKRGESIIYDPALNVRHSHGLNALDSVRQWWHWRKVFKGPSEFKQQ